MSENQNTPFSTKCEILAELWLSHRNDEGLQDFIQYNDVGLPLAWSVAYGVIEPNEKVIGFVDDCWYFLLDGMDIEDTGFLTLEDIVQKYEE